MKTQFESGNYRFEPEHVIYLNCRLRRPWKVWIKQRDALGSFAWHFLGTRFYHPRATKREITA